MPELQRHELRMDVTEADLPEDRFSDHVNNARYFTFVNRAFQSWYRAMGLRGQHPWFGAMMAHCELDFLREVKVPGAVTCRIAATTRGRTRLEHTVEIWDHAVEPPRLAARGRVVHVGVDRRTRQPHPWPEDVLARCWPPDPTEVS